MFVNNVDVDVLVNAYQELVDAQRRGCPVSPMVLQQLEQYLQQGGQHNTVNRGQYQQQFTQQPFNNQPFNQNWGFPPMNF